MATDPHGTPDEQLVETGDVGAALLAPVDEDLSYAEDLAAAMAGDGDDEAEPSQRDDLRKAMRGERQEPEQLDVEAKWKREVDDWVRDYRPDLDRLGKGRRHALRQAMRLERGLRDQERAPATLVELARLFPHVGQALVDAAGRLSPEVGPTLLAELGHHRAQAREYERQAREYTEQYQTALAGAAERISAFAAAHPKDFEQLRPTMGALMQSGAASTIEQAYEQAKRVHGDPAAQHSQSADEARRQAIAKAKAARTPKSASIAAQVHDSDDDPRSNAEVLADELAKARSSRAAGGRR